MLQLAERCEQATGPDRELDTAIAQVLGWKRQGFNLGRGIYDHNGNWHMDEPLFTAFLDAAMTLVPEGWRWCATNGCDEIRPNAFVESPDGETVIQKFTATPALALCAAALRSTDKEERR